MRVAYVTMRFPEPSETFASNEVRILSGLGVDITVHGLRRRHPDHERMVRDRALDGIATRHNGVLASLIGLLHGLARPRLLADALSWVVRRNRGRRRDLVGSLLLLPRAFGILGSIAHDRPDVVHMYWGHYPSLVGYLVQRRFPKLVTSLAIVAYDLGREYAGTVDVARQADVVRTHARVNVDHILRFTGVPRERVEVIYNGLDFDAVTRLAARHTTIPRRLVTVARLVESKGTDTVLEAFAQVRARWPDATLVVVGDGPDESRLRGICAELGIGDAVRFAGFLPHDEALEEVAQAEVFVLLSRNERLPNVVKEGMACGCVCVTTPTGGIEELVEDGVTGFVVPMRDAAAAARVIHDTFAGRVDAAAMGLAAQAFIGEVFDVRQTAPRYRELWAAALRRRDTTA